MAKEIDLNAVIETALCIQINFGNLKDMVPVLKHFPFTQKV